MSKLTKKALSPEEMDGVAGGVIKQMTDGGYSVLADKAESDGISYKSYGHFSSLRDAKKTAKRHFVSRDLHAIGKHGQIEIIPHKK